MSVCSICWVLATPYYGKLPFITEKNLYIQGVHKVKNYFVEDCIYFINVILSLFIAELLIKSII